MSDHPYKYPNEAPYLPPAAEFSFDVRGRKSFEEFTPEESVFMRLEWSIVHFCRHVIGKVPVMKMFEAGDLVVPDDLPLPPSREGKGQDGHGADAESRAKDLMSVESDAKRSFLLGVILTNARRLIEIMPECYAPFTIDTAFRIEKWAIEGSEALQPVAKPKEKPCEFEEKKPFATTLVAKLPSLKDPNRMGRWYVQARTLRHRVSMCSRLITSSADPLPKPLPLPASYFYDKYEIADDTLRKAQKAGRINGIKPDGRWLYFEDDDFRLAFASAIYAADEKRKEQEQRGNRPKG